jgi:hypothetical protein
MPFDFLQRLARRTWLLVGGRRQALPKRGGSGGANACRKRCRGLPQQRGCNKTDHGLSNSFLVNKTCAESAVLLLLLRHSKTKRPPTGLTVGGD